MTRLRSVIVDDEDLARERLRSLLTEYGDIEIVGEYSSGANALREMSKNLPDLLFLDVEMPGMDGFSLLQAIPDDQCPSVIFVTAYNEHAIRAFEVDALDYLLKPFSKERFQRTVDRARARYAGDRDLQYRTQLSRAIKRMQQFSGSARLPIKTESGTSFIAVNDVEWAQAEGNYIRVHAGSVSARLRDTVESFQERLPPDRFIRIHRSIIVNLNRIIRIEPWTHGEFVVVLADGTKLKSGRAYSENLHPLLR
jgi:two-component system LytT family response regulator